MIATSVSVILYDACLVDSVSLVPIVSLNPWAPSILSAPLLRVSLSCTYFLTVNICISYHQLLDDDSLIMIGLGSSL